MHVLRVGTDGSSSDVIVQQWDWSQSGTYTPTATDSYNSTLKQNGSGLSFNEVNIITNADTGALFSWQVDKWGYCTVLTDSGCAGRVDTVIENHLTTTSGGAVSSDVIMNTNNGNQGTGYPVTPILQLADGSYVGTVSNPGVPYSMIGFDASGHTKWTVPNYSPQMATADGSIISYGGTTFDANGNATGQLPSLPTYSWKRAYHGSSASSVAIPSPSLPASYQAVSNGNLTGNGTSVVHTSIGVVWCSSLISGSCNGRVIEGLGLAVQDLGFTYAPWKQMPTQNLTDFTAAHNEWVTQIVGQAMSALASAYKGLPVMIHPVSFAGPPCPNQVWWNLSCLYFPNPPKPSDYSHPVYITGNYCSSQYGSTFEGHSSFICYQDIMEDAQLAVGGYDSSHSWQPLSPSYSAALTPTQTSQFLSIMKAIGFGIGNTAAHETGHQFSLPQMDCDNTVNGTLVGPACPGNGVHDLFYEFWTTDGYPPYVTSSGAQDHYLYSGFPLTWTSQDLASLAQIFLKKN